MSSIKLRALGSAAMLATIALQFSCKTTSSKATTLAGNLPATLSCGPDRTFYFHWASEGGAKGWLADSGAPPMSDMSSLLPASSPRYALSTKTIDSLIRHYKPGPSTMVGPGVYLAMNPIQTSYYGDSLLIFRFRDSQGNGIPCKDWTRVRDPGAAQNMNSPGSPGLPVLAEYNGDAHWLIAPRAPIASQGESVLFSLPQVGDADAFVTEITKKATNIEAFVETSRSSMWGASPPPLSNVCLNHPKNGSQIFLQDVYCRVWVEKFVQILQRSTPSNLSQQARDGFVSLLSLVRRNLTLVPELRTAIYSFDPSLLCNAGPGDRAITSAADLDSLASCKSLSGNYSIQIHDQQASLSALMGIEQINGNLTILVSQSQDSVFSFKALAKLKKVTSLTINARAFADCNTTMQLTDVESLDISGYGAPCIAQFPYLTKLKSLSIGKSGDGFADLSGLQNLENVGSLGLSNLLGTDLVFLDHLRSVAIFRLSNAPKLKSLQPLLSHNPFSTTQSVSSGVNIADVPLVPRNELSALQKMVEAKNISFQCSKCFAN